MSVHSHQIASVIQRAVQMILTRGINDPRVRGLISVTGVQLSDDYAQVTILVSILPEEHSDLTMHGLRHASKHIRSQLGREVRLRRIPRLEFKLDKSLKKQSEVLAALAAARRRDGVEESDPETETPTTESPTHEVPET
ncbi:MAG: 30S ribosome-binding factor RbfA [Planctomycetota bacterium]|nr:30S ribosome-binding factor RbfA [Planctomycetota bacterium]